MNIIFSYNSKFDFGIEDIVAVYYESDTKNFILCDDKFDMGLTRASDMTIQANDGEYLRIYVMSGEGLKFAFNFRSCCISVGNDFIQVKGEKLDGDGLNVKFRLAEYLKIVSKREEK